MINTVIILIPFCVPILQFNVKKYILMIILTLIYTINALLKGDKTNIAQDILVILPSVIILIYIFLV